LKYVYLRDCIHTDQFKDFSELDYEQVIFNYNLLLRNNPIVVYKIEEKSLMDRIHDELVDYETEILEQSWKIFKYEESYKGDEKFYRTKIYKINEVPIDIQTNPYLEFSTYTEELQSLVK